MITRFATLSSRLAVAFSLLFAIVACGGGGGGGGGGFLGDSGGGSGDTDTLFLQVLLKDSDGNPTSIVSSTSPGSLQVLVTKNNAKGNPVPDVIVTASTDSGLLFPSSGSKLTNSEGAVTFRVEAGTGKGAGTIVVSVEDDNGVTVSESVNFQLGHIGLRLGYLEGGDFFDAEIGISPSGPIASQGEAILSLAIVEENGLPVQSAESIRVNSPCLSTGDATTTPANPVASVTGQVTITYKANGCQGTDSLTAELVGSDAKAFGDIEIASPSANGLTFVSATPELIVLKGTGGGPNRVEKSEVVFRAVNSDNEAVEGVSVSFSLTTDVGGITFNPASAVSAADGTVSTVVSSGDVATVVRVIATADAENEGNGVSTVSDVLTVTTGLPDQNSISLGVAGDFVVEQGMNVNGLTREIVVHMADKFNNPVPDGTAAVFTTEYGSVESTCTTVNGECQVTWTSQDPRFPTLEENLPLVRGIFDSNYSCPAHNGTSGPCPADMGPVQGGRSTVLVTAIGEESFIDRNGNGIFDEEEAEAGLFRNLTEAFIDHNEDHRGPLGINLYDPGATDCLNGSNSLDCQSGVEETFVDFNSNGVFDANGDKPNNGYPDEGVTAVYNGLLCPPEGDEVWCSRELLNVWDSVPVILGAGPPYYIGVYRGTTPVSSTRYGNEYEVYVSDVYNNRPPQGTNVSISASGSCEVTILTESQVQNTPNAGAFGVSFSQGGVGEEEGEVKITVKGTTVTLPCTPEPPPPEPEEGEGGEGGLSPGPG